MDASEKDGVRVVRKHVSPSPHARVDYKREPFIKSRFGMRPSSTQRLRSTPWSFGFGAFSEVVYRDNNYCRVRGDGKLEEWPDTIQRVVEGVMSIRKDWYRKNRLLWDEGLWQERAEGMALAFLRLECGPPGRGYNMMGSEFVYERGAMSLINCAYTRLEALTLDRDLGWAADALLCGCGVGFECIPDPKLADVLKKPWGAPSIYVVPDTREGWAEAIELLVGSYMGKTGPVDYDYSEIRKGGSLIKGRGGICPGSGPLEKAIDRMRSALDRFCLAEISGTRLKADLANMTGACVFSGGVRRSAEILIGDVDDEEFLDLKDYSKYPEREEWGWLSNNSPRLTRAEHFCKIPTHVAPRARLNGEPGLLNMIATGRFARFGREKHDPADGINPCGELPLVNKEICVAAGTRVLTKQGYRDIATLDGLNVTVAAGLSCDEDFDSEGGFFEAEVFSTGVKPVLVISTVDGRRIRCTENHPLLVERNGERGWVQASDIREGDNLVAGALSIEGDAGGVDPVFYALGHFAGDGWLLDENGRIVAGFCGGPQDADLIARLVLVWGDILEKQAQGYIQSNYDDRYHRPLKTRTQPNGVLLVAITKPHVVRMLRERYGFSPGRAPVKRFPSGYWVATSVEKAAFLRGLYDADGSVINTARRAISLTAANEEFARDALLALSEFGIVARMTTHYIKERDQSQTILQVRGADNIQEFARQIYFEDGAFPSRKADVLASAIQDIQRVRHGSVFCVVSSITPDGESAVYNMEVADARNFIAEGVVVHNCNLSENYPSRCPDEESIIRAVEATCLYSSTVALLPTHRSETNAVVSRHRRIGVGMSGIADWEARSSVAEMTRILRRAYKAVVNENERLAAEAGVPASIRCTTVKPSGTVSLLAGVSPGGHFAMGRFYIRRKRVSTMSPYRAVFDAAGYPWEPAVDGDNTVIYEFPQAQPNVRTQALAGMFEQALQLCMLQREWSDNAVSFTIEFDPVTEGDQLGNLMAQIAPMTKSLSVLPRHHDYKQPPYEEITEREYKLRVRMVKSLDWSLYAGGEGSDEPDKFCEAGVCEIKAREVKEEDK